MEKQKSGCLLECRRVFAQLLFDKYSCVPIKVVEVFFCENSQRSSRNGTIDSKKVWDWERQDVKSSLAHNYKCFVFFFPVFLFFFCSVGEKNLSFYFMLFWAATLFLFLCLCWICLIFWLHSWNYFLENRCFYSNSNIGRKADFFATKLPLLLNRKGKKNSSELFQILPY